MLSTRSSLCRHWAAWFRVVVLLAVRYRRLRIGTKLELKGIEPQHLEHSAKLESVMEPTLYGDALHGHVHDLEPRQAITL